MLGMGGKGRQAGRLRRRGNRQARRTTGRRFCELTELPTELRDDTGDPVATRHGVAECIGRRAAAEWEQLFAGEDICFGRVRSVCEALTDPHFVQRGIFTQEGLCLAP